MLPYKEAGGLPDVWFSFQFSTKLSPGLAGIGILGDDLHITLFDHKRKDVYIQGQYWTVNSEQVYSLARCRPIRVTSGLSDDTEGGSTRSNLTLEKTR